MKTPLLPKSCYLIGIVLIFFTSCTSSPESLKAIPAETNFVSVINLYSVAKKGKLEDISQLKFFKTLKKEIRNENKKLSKIIDNIMEDPTITGIDFKSDIFGYYVNEARDEQYACLTADLGNEEKFAEFLEDALDKSDLDYDIEKEKTYKYTIVSREMAIGWDEDKLILLIANNSQSRKNLDIQLETLFELEGKDQIMDNQEFTNFYDAKKDFSVWFSSNLFEDNREFKEIEKDVDFDITDNYFSAYLSFNDDDVSLVTNFTANEEIQKIMEENKIWDNTFNSDLLKMLPKENFATASLSIDPMAYFNILEESDEFDEVKDEFEEEMGFSMKEAFENLKGSAVFNLFGFEKMEYTYLGYGYGFNENDGVLMDKRYEISEAGYLSMEEKESLNLGKTIQCQKFNRQYCINIKNILAEGGSIETALENNSLINWYQGGWDFGKYVETTKEELLPLMGLAFDLNDNKILKEILNKIPEEEVNKRNDYYEFKVDGKYPAFFAFNEKMCFITNDKKSIKSFNEGGLSSNLGDSKIATGIKNCSYYSHFNLDYDAYPKELKKEMKNGNMNKGIFSEFSGFTKGIEFKSVSDNSVEINLQLVDSDNNSLNTIITTLDDNYKKYMQSQY